MTTKRTPPVARCTACGYTSHHIGSANTNCPQRYGNKRCKALCGAPFVPEIGKNAQIAPAQEEPMKDAAISAAVTVIYMSATGGNF